MWPTKKTTRPKLTDIKDKNVDFSTDAIDYWQLYKLNVNFENHL